MSATPPPDELAARGRAIFERLRGEGLAGAGVDADADEEADGLPTEPEPAAGASDGGSQTRPVVERSQAHPDPPAMAAEVGPPPTEPEPGAPPEEGLSASEDGLPGQAADVAARHPGSGSLDATSVEPSPAEISVPRQGPELGVEGSPVAAVAPGAAADGEGPREEPLPDLPRVMAVANQKGGVGKTTTAVNLGACLADLGYRVLIVDLDPQGNASTGLGINIRDLQASMYDVLLRDVPIDDCIEATSVRNLFVAAASLDLAGAEIELVPAFSREMRLKQALAEVIDDYDFVLIDCPPSLGLLTVNGLAAATEVMVPIQCEYYALEGLGQLSKNVALVQKSLNPGLELRTIVLVMYDARTKLADQVVQEVRAHFGARVCRQVIPRTVRLSEAPSFGQPIIAFDATSRGAIAYRELAKEVSGGAPQRVG